MFWGMNSNCISTCLCMSHLWSTHVYNCILVTGTATRRRHTFDINLNDNKNVDNIERVENDCTGYEWIYIYIHLYWKYLEAYWWYGAISGLLTSSGAAILCNGFCTCLTYHFTTPYESAVTRAYFLSLNRVKLSGTTKVLTWWIILP